MKYLIGLLFIPLLAQGQIIGRSSFYVPQTAAAAAAAIAFVDTGGFNLAASSLTYAANKLVLTGDNLAIVVGIWEGYARTVDSITWGAQKLTRQTHTLPDDQTNRYFSVWTLLNATSGTDSVRFYNHNGAGENWSMVSSAWANVGSFGTIDDSTNSATNDSGAVTVASATGEVVVGCHYSADGWTTFGDGQTSLGTYGVDGDMTSLMSYKAGAASVTMLILKGGKPNSVHISVGVCLKTL
jgi:hypothetical protein